MGTARTTEHGNARIDYYLTLYDQFSDIQDQRPVPLTRPGTSNPCAPMISPRHILMTADTVGGVWTYAVELARGLTANGVHVSLATMGAPLSREQRSEVQFNDVQVFESSYKLEWMENPWQDVDAAGEWLLDLDDRLQPDLIHLNNYAHGKLDWRAPVLMVGHSCVYSWWRAVHGDLAYHRVDGISSPCAGRLTRRRHGRWRFAVHAS